MADLAELPRPTADEHFRYIRGFLLTLTLCFGLGGIGMIVYDAYTAGVASDAKAALGEEPGPDAIKAAFQIVETPHLFSGWRVPDSILPPGGDPDLSVYDEEVLAKAVIAAPEVEAPTAKSKNADECGQDLVCVAVALGKPYDTKKTRRMPQRVKVHQYLLLRRTMARGEPMTDAQLRFFQWNRPLWVRAFRKQVMDLDAAPQATDATMVAELTAILEEATHNGAVFGWYGVGAGALFGGFLLLWIRRKDELQTEAG